MKKIFTIILVITLVIVFSITAAAVPLSDGVKNVGGELIFSYQNDDLRIPFGTDYYGSYTLSQNVFSIDCYNHYDHSQYLRSGTLSLIFSLPTEYLSEGDSINVHIALDKQEGLINDLGHYVTSIDYRLYGISLDGSTADILKSVYYESDQVYYSFDYNVVSPKSYSDIQLMVFLECSNNQSLIKINPKDSIYVYLTFTDDTTVFFGNALYEPKFKPYDSTNQTAAQRKETELYNIAQSNKAVFDANQKDFSKNLSDLGLIEGFQWYKIVIDDFFDQNSHLYILASLGVSIGVIAYLFNLYQSKSKKSEKSSSKKGG